jgi:hypothetical protein
VESDWECDLAVWTLTWCNTWLYESDVAGDMATNWVVDCVLIVQYERTTR